MSPTGSLASVLEYYMNVRLLNFILSVSMATVVCVSYFVKDFIVLTVIAVMIGTLGGQVNVCNVSAPFSQLQLLSGETPTVGAGVVKGPGDGNWYIGVVAGTHSSVSGVTFY